MSAASCTASPSSNTKDESAMQRFHLHRRTGRPPDTRGPSPHLFICSGQPQVPSRQNSSFLATTSLPFASVFSISVETLAAPTNLHTVSTPHHICRTQSARVTAGNLGVPEPTPIVRVLVRCHPWFPNRWKHDYSPSTKGKLF